MKITPQSNGKYEASMSDSKYFGIKAIGDGHYEAICNLLAIIMQ